MSPVPPSPAIEVTGLVKEFRGVRALDGLTLTVQPGSVYGFLGRNGSGKTTTLRILLGLARATAGTARVLGRPVGPGRTDLLSGVGYLPDVPGYYPWMTAREFLVFCGGLFGLTGRVLQDRIDVLLSMAGLDAVSQPIEGYSRGMRQRLGIAQALVNAPSLLLLDEPTSALDPLGRRDVLEMVTALRGQTTVFFSTHVLADVERVCDTVGILEQGRMIVQGPVDEIRSRYAAGRRVLVQLDAAGANRIGELQAVLSSCPWAGEIHRRDQDGGPALEVGLTDPSAAARALPRLIAERELGLLRLEPLEASLEDVFVSLVGRP